MPDLPNPQLPLIQAEALCVRRGGRTIVSDATFSLGAGVWALRGANGSGKSTLLRTLAGITLPAFGTARIGGFDIEHDPVRAREQLGYAPEDTNFFPYLLADEFLETVAALRGVSAQGSLAAFTQLVDGHAGRKRIGSLSAGQRRKLAIVAATCGAPKVVLLDEPTNALDTSTVAWLESQVTRWAEAGTAVLVAMHGEPLSAAFSGVLGVENGRIRRFEPQSH